MRGGKRLSDRHTRSFQKDMTEHPRAPRAPLAGGGLTNDEGEQLAYENNRGFLPFPAEPHGLLLFSRFHVWCSTFELQAFQEFCAFDLYESLRCPARLGELVCQLADCNSDGARYLEGGVFN